MFNQLLQRVVQFLNEDYERSRYNIFFGSIIFFVGHPFYWAVNVYLLNEKFDSVFFRFSSSLCSLLVILFLYKTERNYQKFKPLFMIYWYLWVMWILPITYTYIMLMNDVSIMWIVAETIMIFLVILFITNFVVISVVLSLGVYLGYYFFLINSFNTISIPIHELRYAITLLPLALICGTLFLEKAKQGDFEKRKATIFRSLAGSIAHELRNPLNSINAVIVQIENLINQVQRTTLSENEIILVKKNLYNDDLVKKIVENSNLADSERNSLIEFVDSISKSSKDANDIIDLVLSDLREKSIDETEYYYANTTEIIELIQRHYPQSSYANRIIFEAPKDTKIENLFFKITKQRFYFIFNNIIKNALYYVHQFPNMTIKISFDQQFINDKVYNIISFTDNGPGIQASKITKLFKDFTTFSKKGGTGLGLAFCKKNMKILGGDIMCESEYGYCGQGWTKFSLLFSYPTNEELQRAQEISKLKKILLVDDHKINLIALKTKIEKLMPRISCDIANSGKEAILMSESYRYNLVLMDIQMPHIDGIEASHRIKRIRNNVPIIAATSLSYETFISELDKREARNNFVDYISKVAPNNHLIRTIAKNITDYSDNFLYLGIDKNKIISILVGKKIILADDQDLNRVITRKILEKYGIIVVEARNGSEVINLYNKSIDEKGCSSFDAIITDINMNYVSGEDASLEIRKIEEKNKIYYGNRIPIIALSGDGSNEMIVSFFRAGIDDYFIKGNNFDNLIKIIANFFIKIDPSIYAESIDLDQHSEKQNSNEELVFNANFINNFSFEEKNKIIELFIEDSQEIIGKIKKHTEEGNIKMLNPYVHSLKGILANIGAEKFANFIKKLDLALKSDEKMVNQAVFQIESLYLELIEELKNHLKSSTN